MWIDSPDEQRICECSNGPLLLTGSIEVANAKYYGTVRVKVAVCTNVPDVPVTVMVEVVGAAVVVVVEDPHPLSMVKPIALTTVSISICRRRRFLRPNIHKASAKVASGLSLIHI